jgi:hypothetical protein
MFTNLEYKVVSNLNMGNRQHVVKMKAIGVVVKSGSANEFPGKATL